LLRKRGHTVFLAGNGREALEALEKFGFDGFDVVLMDVQMPEMGGFEATAAIREREKMLRKHLPIVAMTAHALKGDRERCLEAGMDGYVSKPIRTVDLFAEIERCVSAAPDAAGEEAAAPSDAAPKAGGLFHREELLERVEGDRELLAEMVELFEQDSPRLLAAIREAVARGDGGMLERAAHTLKGSVSNFAAPAATAAALRLEQMGREGKLEQSGEACTALEAEIEHLRPALAELCQEMVR